MLSQASVNHWREKISDKTDLQLLGGGWGTSSSSCREKLGVAKMNARKGTNQPDHLSLSQPFWGCSPEEEECSESAASWAL